MRRVLFGLLLVFASTASLANQAAFVFAEKLNVRASPSTSSAVVDQVSKGDRLFVAPVSGDWARITGGANAGGFVSKHYLRLTDRPSALSELQPQLVDSTFTGETDRKGHHELSWLLLLVLAILFAILLVLRPLWKASEKRGRAPEKSTNPDPARNISVRANQNAAKRDLHDASLTKQLDLGKPSSAIDELPLAKVQHVIDGDTVIISGPWRKTKIRLDSIDCPEDGQPWGEIATAGLIKMIGGRRIKIEEHGQDCYGRLIATIYVEGMHDSDWVNVNEKMVAKGHAWVMRKHYGHLTKRRQDKLNHLERWARTRRVGLWRTQNPVPPWRWRQGN